LVLGISIWHEPDVDRARRTRGEDAAAIGTYSQRPVPGSQGQQELPATGIPDLDRAIAERDDPPAIRHELDIAGSSNPLPAGRLDSGCIATRAATYGAMTSPPDESTQAFATSAGPEVSQAGPLDRWT
jgi:hypothetical protein